MKDFFESLFVCYDREMFNKKTIRLSGEIDQTTKPAIIRVKPNSGDIWTDYGYWLEATNFMAYQAMLAQGWNKKQILEYTTNYLKNSLDDIEIKGSI